MKAILVVDLPDKTVLDNVYADVLVYGGQQRGAFYYPLIEPTEMKNVKVKPLPPVPYHIDDDQPWIMYRKGWNKCIEEITK